MRRVGGVLTGREVGAEKPSTHCPIKAPILSPCDLPNLSLNQLPQAQRIPVPRLTHISRWYADHSVGGARQTPDADPPGSVHGWLRGARRAAAGPQRSQCPHQRPGRSAPPGPGVTQTLPLPVWAPSSLPGPAPGLPLPWTIPQLLQTSPSVSPAPGVSFVSACSFLGVVRSRVCCFQTFPQVSWPVPGAISLIWSSPEHLPVCRGHPPPSMPALASSQPVPPSATPILFLLPHLCLQFLWPVPGTTTPPVLTRPQLFTPECP